MLTIYTFDVFITSGPMMKKFIKQNPVVSRTIEIQGEQTLEDLHRIIFQAFDRVDEHMYEFQIGGKGPNDPKARSYSFSEEFGAESGSGEQVGNSTRTAIKTLKLKIGDIFGYWFDFGNDWWHQINVVAIEERTSSGGVYPKVTKKIGASPPQYVDDDL